MSSNPSKAFEVDNGIIIDGNRGIYSFDSISGAPSNLAEGSMALTQEGSFEKRNGSWVSVGGTSFPWDKIPFNTSVEVKQYRQMYVRDELVIEGELIVGGTLWLD